MVAGGLSRDGAPSAAGPVPRGRVSTKAPRVQTPGPAAPAFGGGHGAAGALATVGGDAGTAEGGRAPVRLPVQ